MSISTYNDIKATVATYLGRSDLTALIPDFISMAEAYLNREVRALDRKARASVSVTSGVDTATLPSDMWEIIDLRHDDNDYHLNQVSVAELFERYDDTAGRMYYYAVADKFYFESPSDKAYTLTCDYFKKFDLATNSTNWLMTNHPDCYLAATMVEAAKYMRNYDLASGWKVEREEAVGDANSQVNRTRRKATMTVDEGLHKRGRFNIYSGY